MQSSALTGAFTRIEFPALTSSKQL